MDLELKTFISLRPARDPQKTRNHPHTHTQALLYQTERGVEWVLNCTYTLREYDEKI